ncbi:MAG: CD1845 family protein [Clostridia bacterium]
MKILLKILFAPVMVLMWIAIKIGVAITYVSGLALGIISGSIVVISIVYMFTGARVNGLIGLVIAYILSPYGIPMFIIMMLGAVHRIRENLKYIIYG